MPKCTLKSQLVKVVCKMRSNFHITQLVNFPTASKFLLYRHCGEKSQGRAIAKKECNYTTWVTNVKHAAALCQLEC